MQLHHGLAEGHSGTVRASCLMVFFAIWWAWMSFTWFASAHERATRRTGCSRCCGWLACWCCYRPRSGPPRTSAAGSPGLGYFGAFSQLGCSRF
ncbi:low temperature requirement protein A [Saccharopolyspora halophila]|uniref:low temperature requirement protein A n=1 Tax=Saccharopolyspora halophila TaxID=405551 RepID=UPI0031D70E49